MLMDNFLFFSNAQAVTNTQASTYAIDLATGQKFTSSFDTAPNLKWSVNQTYFGEDLGIGQGVGFPQVWCAVGTAFLSAGSSTIQIAIQGAPENNTAHANGLRSSLSFVTYAETGTIAKSLLTAGANLFRINLPARKPGEAMPRFLQMNYSVATADFTAGALSSALLLERDDWINFADQYGSGFSVGA